MTQILDWTETSPFHNRVGELIDQHHLTIDQAIEQAVWEHDHPGQDRQEWFESLNIEAVELPDTLGALLSQETVKGGRCHGCEHDADELLPWASLRLCWDCVDVQLDLMAKAVMEAGPVPVVMGVAS